MNVPASKLSRIIGGCLLAFAGIPGLAYATGSATSTSGRWSPAILELARTIPVQEGGRVKPLDTLARFKLLKLHGKRSIRVQQHGETTRLDAVEWLLDSLFYPEIAVEYPTFTVDNNDVVVAIGVTPSNKKRDQYSYTALQTGIDRLYELARQFAEIEDKQRSPHQRMTVNLAANVNDFEFLIHYLDVARYRADAEIARAVKAVAGGPRSNLLSASQILADLPGLRRELASSRNTADSAAPKNAIENVLIKMLGFRDSAEALPIFPPTSMDEQEWRTAGMLIYEAFQADKPEADCLDYLALLEKLTASRSDPDVFLGDLRTLHGKLKAQASARSEYRKIPLEVNFYQINYFFHSLCFYLLGFLVIALSWLLPGNSRIGRLGIKLGPVLVIIPLVIHMIGIVMRCVIRGRPPVSTLYETILFITGVVVLLSLTIEFMNRQRIAVAIAAALGTAGMFLAVKYEAKEGVDTMPSLVAVLDTNFWLSTHVTTVTIGYAAGLLASGIAHVYVMGRLFRDNDRDEELSKSMTRMVYGVICFGLFFSFIGTVLGGIWANYSWGRFWGWDPKENGALMIVLWNIIILHAKMGGYIRDMGIHLCAIFGGIVVSFSWWGVNLLGIGLHSYGFTSGIFRNLVIFWTIETLVIILGLQHLLSSPAAAAQKTARG